LLADPIRVLLIDDDEDEFVLTRHLLAESRMSAFTLDWTPDSEAALDDMARDQHDIYLLDYRMGARDGLEILREALAIGCSAPVVILSGQGDNTVDLAAMRAGAADYLVKGRISGELLERALRHAVERKRIEKQLARQREEFVAMLTHDIKSPLHVVIGAADMLLEESKNLSNGREQALIRNLIDSALTINSLVVNYLDFTKIEAVGVNLTKQSVVIGDLLARLHRRYETSAQRRGLLLDLQLATELPTVHGDPVALERIFANLVSNAIKFTANGGYVKISAKSNDRGIVIAVTDNGPGILPDEIPFIFAKYRRALNTARQDGAGLGLFIAKSLVEAHDGKIQVHSEPGRETRFEVFLPTM
jgi:two-component system sensor histidine kinase/response regulator